MNATIAILNGRGDTRLEWDPADPARCEEMRQMVADLKSRGYVFFLADGATPADEVSAGAGTLLVRRVEADDVVDVAIEAATRPAPGPEPEPEPAPPAETGTGPDTKRRRGRPPKAPAVVAVRPIQGG
jgi:hypothetical protein